MISPNKLRRLRQHIGEDKPIEGARVLELVTQLEDLIKVGNAAIKVASGTKPMEYLRGVLDATGHGDDS